MHGPPPDDAGEALRAAARERLRAHLDREAASLAADDPERVLGEVRQLAERLRETAR